MFACPQPVLTVPPPSRPAGVLPCVVALALALTAGIASAACTDAPARRVNWYGCAQPGADLGNIDLRGAVLEYTDFSAARFAGAQLEDADFGRSRLAAADFTRATLSNARFVAATLDAANFSGARLDGARLERAQAAGVRVSLATVQASLDSLSV